MLIVFRKKFRLYKKSKKNIKNIKNLNIKKLKKIKWIFWIFIFFNIILWAIYIFLMQFDKYVVPSALQISEKYAINIVNQEINTSVQNTINSLNLTTNDFISKEVISDTSYLDVNTMLINNICSTVSNNISQKLQHISDTKVDIPIGVFSGTNAFSNLGPNLKITISTIGDSRVDYETVFKSVGINQINLEIYLTIETSIAIINPLYKENINITRKLMLINTIFNGEVPSTYLNTNSLNSLDYLNSSRNK